MNIDYQWHAIVHQVLAQPARTDIWVEKWRAPHPKQSGFYAHVGLPKGQMADYRYALTDGRGIHVREYDGTYAVHWDEVDPSVNVVGHLVRDAPGVVLLGALALGLILGALEG